MRIVLDTNVLISAVLSPGGLPADLFDRWNDDEYELVTSTEQIAELSRVLTYPRVVKAIKGDAGAQVVARLKEAAILAEELPLLTESADPDDNIILATAVAGRADLIVTGDAKHLLPLREVQGIPVVTVADALERLLRQRG